MTDDSDDGSLGSVEMAMEPDETEVIELDSAEDEVMEVEEDEEGIQLIELDEAKGATSKQNGDTHKGESEKEKPKKSKKSDQSDDSDDKQNGPSEKDSGKSKKPKKKSYKDDESDESFYSNLSPKELKSLKKSLMSEKDLDQNSMVCTACYKQVNYKQEGAVLRHTDLAVPICKKCKKFYYKGSWKKDSEGYYEHCRWCGNGGDLMCCDECPNAFCKKCIKRNLGRSKVSEIENAAKWQCLACEPSQIAQQRALYYSIWTYTVKESKTEEQLKEQAKMRNKSKFVDEGHKGGFEVTRILNNYLQKSNKNWLQKTQGQVEQGDVTKLVVKFRTIIKIAHHNLEMLDKNLVEGCTSSYPDITEEMLDAMTIPEDQNGETDEGPKENGEKKKKPVKKKPAAKPSTLNVDTEEENKTAKKNEEQKKLREKRNEERLAKTKEEETSAKVSNGEDLSEIVEDSASNDSETKENGGKIVNEEIVDSGDDKKTNKKSNKMDKKDDNSKETKQQNGEDLDESNVSETNGNGGIIGKIVNEESVDSRDNKKTKKNSSKMDKVDKGSKETTQQSGEDLDAPDASRDMFDSSAGEEQIKESTPELDDANKAARAFLLETSSDEEGTENKSGENNEPDEETEQKEIPKIKIKDLKKLQENKSGEEEEDNKPGTKDGSPKKKLKTKRELDSLRRKSEEKPKEKAKSDNENDEVKCEEDEAGIIKEEDGVKDKQDKKEKKLKTKAQAFTSSDSDDSDEDRLGIEGGTPEKNKSKKEEKKIKEKEEKKILEREKRKQERKEKNKDKEGKKKKKRDDSESSEERVEGKVEKKLRKKAEKTLKKLRRKAEDVDINTPQLSKMKIRATVVPLSQDIKDELEMDEFVDVTCHSNLYVAKEQDNEDDIDRLCNFRSLKAVKKAVLGSSSDGDGEDNHTLNKSKGVKKEKNKEVGVADMSSGSDEHQSDGAESDNNPKNLCSSTSKKSKKTEAKSSSEGDEHSEDSATEEGKKAKKDKKARKTKAKEEDGGSDEVTKKPKSKKLALLSMKLDEEDTSDEERKYREKKERKKAKDLEDGKNDDSTDSSDEEQMSHATLHGSAKKKLSDKKRKKALADSDEEDNDSDKSEDSDDSDDSSEEEAPKKKEPKKRGRKKASSSSEDSCEEKRPKKRKRIKGDADDSEKEDDDDDENSPTKRHNIKKVIKDKNLAEETKSAQQTETERRDRIKERQQRYNKIFGTEAEDKVKRAIADEVVLDYDEKTKEVLVEVDKRLVKHLKPHQVGGIKFMWDSCFESIAQIEANKCPGGAILGHCMGLGKTLQSVAITHTILTNSRVGVDRVMVLCPVNVVKNWADEYDKWLLGDLAVDVYEMSNEKDNHGRADKLECWFKEGGVLLIGYDMFRNLTNDANKKVKPKMRATFTKCLLDPGADLIICDEGHLLKNEKSAINKAVNRIKTKKRIVLSGTPLQNNLKEYYEMVNFVKPSLMGTRKEFMNRFVNPIVNGQHADSTEMDMRKMKKRSFILSDLLKGCMQRLDYNVLVPYLMPKLEYVLTIELTPTQKTLYKFYLENYAKAGQIGNDGKLVGGKKGGLFYDKQNLSRIWNHPYILLLAKMKKDMKDDEYDDSGDEGSLKDFVVDSTEDETEESSDESTEDSEDSDASVKAKKKKKKPTKRATRADKPTELATLDDKNVVQKMSGGGAWWTQHLPDEQELDDLMLGSKMTLLMDILKECAMIGDKLLVFSQSILSLDLIEEFLEKVHNENELTKKKNDGMDDVLGTWVPGKDYYRMDGSTAADTRKIWCKFFNKESNHRMRLFLISTKAGGLGINLVAANRVIIFDASWNPSHDVQSIFRVFRFGQTKPVYIYRFLAKGTMEEKIYDRQVTKQSMSARVVDEHQIDCHFTMNELTELYEFKDEPQSEKPIPIVPEDRLLAEIVDKHKDLVWNIHNHDSLLENKVDENLNEDDRKAAWAEFENEKKGYVQQMAGPNNAWTAGLAQMQQQQAAMQQQINPMAIQAQLKMMYPEMNHEELMTRTRWTIMQMQQQMVNEMAARQKQQQEQQQLMQQQQLMRQAQQLSDQMRMAKQGSSGNTVRQQLSDQLRQAQEAQLRQQQALQSRGISLTKKTATASDVITIDEEDGKEQ